MPDTELWRLFGVVADVRATLRELRNPAQQGSWNGDLYGLELRIERAGELHLSEVFKDRAKLEMRSAELRGVLMAKGWKLPE